MISDIDTGYHDFQAIVAATPDTAEHVTVATDFAGISFVELAERANVLHAGCQASARSMFDHALELGGILTAVKGRCEHGEFVAWIESSCTFKVRTAQAYMRLFHHRAELEGVMQDGELTLRMVLALVARPNAQHVALLADNNEPPDLEINARYAAHLEPTDADHVDHRPDDAPVDPSDPADDSDTIELFGSSQPDDDNDADHLADDGKVELLSPAPAVAGRVSAPSDVVPTTTARRKPGPLKVIELAFGAIERELDKIDGAAKSKGHKLATYSATLRKQVRSSHATLMAWKKSGRNRM
jgi:hypothetical protein